MANKRVIELPAGSITANDQILVDNPTDGARQVSAASLGLATEGYVSAGVYDSGNCLIRTLARSVSAADLEDRHLNWDGRLDNGSVATTGTYTLKVLTHNARWDWEGVLGNTSINFTDQAKFHRPTEPLISMAITAAGAMYYGCGYAEGWGTSCKTSTADPRTNQFLLAGAPHGNVNFVATDGTLVYFSGYDIWTDNSYIFALNCSDDTLAGGTDWGGNGVSTTASYTSTPLPAMNYLDSLKKRITGLAVQQSGSWIFSTRANANSVYIHNKTTGAAAASSPNTTYTAPKALCIDPSPGADHLWMVYTLAGNPVIERFTVDAGTGAITASGVNYRITGLSNPVAMAISPDGSTLLVADAGSQQVVKAFNTSSGVAAKTAFGSSGVFGVVGGYNSTNGPAVPALASTPKFFFEMGNYAHYLDQHGLSGMSFIAFESDGSWWVGDTANWRALHYSGSGGAPANTPVFVEQIAYMPMNQTVAQQVDNDETRVITGWLEYQIDYSKSLQEGWTLAKNWWGGPSSPYAPQNSPRNVAKFGGRTYFITWSPTVENTADIVELNETVGIRRALEAFDYIYKDRMFLPNGDIILTENDYLHWGQVGQTLQWKRYPLLSQDGSGNLTYGPAELLFETAQTFTATDPNNDGFFHWSNKTTTSGIRVFLDRSQNGGKPHLGGFHPDGTWAFRAFPAVPATFHFAKYPPAFCWPIEDGYTDTATGNANSPGWVDVLDNLILTTYQGEGWSGGQCHVVNMWHESGLFLGAFAGAQAGFWNWPASVPGFGKVDAGLTGNCVAPRLSKNNGTYYAYGNDESHYGGVHRWRFVGADTIKISSQTISWDSTSYVAPAARDPHDLLANLPHNETLTNGVGGWTRYPTTDSAADPIWQVWSNQLVYDRFKTPDIAFRHQTIESLTYEAATVWVRREIPRELVSRNWLLEAELTVAGFASNLPSRFSFDVLDPNDLIIARLEWTFFSDYPNAKVVLNNNVLWQVALDQSTDPVFRNYVGQPRAFTIQASERDRKLTMTYGRFDPVVTPVNGTYDANANWRIPAAIRLLDIPENWWEERQMSVTKLRIS